MAGGFGTRLRPLTMNIPKPMVPIVNIPIMHRIITLLKKNGITDIIALVYYQPDVIMNYFKDGKDFGVNITYVKAEADFGTAGSVKNAENFIGEDEFLVISGDVLTDIDLSKAIEYHHDKKSKATIVITRVKNPLPYGIVIVRDSGEIIRFLEKPSWGEVFSDTINTGIYVLDPSVLEFIPYKQEFDFSKNLFPLLLEKKFPFYGYIAESYWRDIGTLSDYLEAHLDCLAGQVEIEIKGERIETPKGVIYVGENVKVADYDRFEGVVVIGNNTRIGKKAKIINSVIGSFCEIEDECEIIDSVIWDRTKVKRRAKLTLDVIGYDNFIGEGAEINENVFISDRCIIGSSAKLLPNIKLWPLKVVEDGSILSKSLVWEDKWLSELFTEARVSGISNIEMTPEFGAKLGAAFGALLGQGKTVIVSRDADNVSRMMNRALICGLISAGLNVDDIRIASIPMVRHELRSGRYAGGLHVRKSPVDKNQTDIIFFDSNGMDLPVGKAKAIERLFFGEDFPRVPHDKVGTINFPVRTIEGYVEKFLSALNIDAIRKQSFKIAIDYSNGVAVTVLPNILGQLGCQVISLNAYLEPTKLTRSDEEFKKAVDELSQIVTSIKCDVGFMLNPGAERIWLIDERGKLLSDNRLLSIVTKLFLSVNATKVKKIAVPISASLEVDLIASEYGIEVVRTKNSHYGMMEAVLKDPEIKFVGGTKGGFIFPEFLFASDGMFAISKILELMALAELKIGEIEEKLPKLFLKRLSIPCPRDLKGKVMRYATLESEKSKRQLIDGVKIFLDDLTWVLILPDRQRSEVHLFVESNDEKMVDKLIGEYSEKVRSWIMLQEK
ncbi:mannose-1-phosphate guanylyltransferase / phosphomannomutase [Candidatus Thermokryptus mobilis]|uniref:Mannose-1-phosphate guanylyltransferase / phosphomannomutase n=2 Tax=Candidatus Thermokryptus mobilis TaxID=1643428 RepID=A0A0S4N3V7_9BACT|nr:mannose-1-phosphate guanylyltransferase / phosphomannomutase [Candidatus Thermokryptus mobilis]